jgi:hypothetical protein
MAMVNLSQNVKHPDPRALPVIVFVDEYQALLAKKVENNGHVREQIEVIL